MVWGLGQGGGTSAGASIPLACRACVQIGTWTSKLWVPLGSNPKKGTLQIPEVHFAKGCWDCITFWPSFRGVLNSATAEQQATESPRGCLGAGASRESHGGGGSPPKNMVVVFFRPLGLIFLFGRSQRENGHLWVSPMFETNPLGTLVGIAFRRQKLRRWHTMYKQHNFDHQQKLDRYVDNYKK